MDVREAHQILQIQEQSLRELQRQFGTMENPPSIYLEVSDISLILVHIIYLLATLERSHSG